MRTHISTRRCEATEEMRARAEELAERLARQEPRLVMAKYMFEAAGERRTVSAVFGIPDDDALVAHAESADWSGALRELEGRLLRQLEERGEEREAEAEEEGTEGR